MTHKDIYTKFMIEYDKAGASTSYPSLTEYEVATVLDKAYNALIAQKVTGNNVRRSTVESDIKSIADLGPLTKTANIRYDEDYYLNRSYYIDLSEMLQKTCCIFYKLLCGIPMVPNGHHLITEKPMKEKMKQIRIE